MDEWVTPNANILGQAINIVCMSLLVLILFVGGGIALKAFFNGDIYAPPYPSNHEEMSDWTVGGLKRLYGGMKCGKAWKMSPENRAKFSKWAYSCEKITHYKELAEELERDAEVKKIYRSLRFPK